MDRVRSLRTAAIAGGLGLLLLALPAHAGASIITLGSDLSQPANASSQQPVDTAMWNLTVQHLFPVSGAMPAAGQIVAVRVKGIAMTPPGAPPPLTEIHFQDLQPQTNGSVFVHASSQPFNLPSSGDPNQVSSYAPQNLCVNQGDFLAFNDEGGFDPNFYPQGVQFQVLANVPGSVTDSFSMHNGTGNGNDFTGMPMPGQELLMQWDLATGPDATPLCPGGTSGLPSPPPPPPPDQQGLAFDPQLDQQLSALPPPVLYQSADVGVLSGTVLYKPPAHTALAGLAHASKATKGQGFIPLIQPRQIPVGSTLDTTHGAVRVRTATTTPGVVQVGDFFSGQFMLLQRRSQRGLVDLNLTGGRARTASTCASVGKKASAALSKRALRLLTANVRGRFRSRGHYSAATVRGTEWQTVDRCDGTLTRVLRGTVVVRDVRRRKNIIITAGKHYLARAPATLPK